MAVTAAERLLQELGVTDPNEIDLEAIAYHLGANVRYAPLDGCEARIIGFCGSAIITVNANSSLPRKRFSIAHELGHWIYHRGKSLVCRVEEYRPQGSLAAERVADFYAADLLMPRFLFHPLARQHPTLNFKTVSSLAHAFRTSQTAAAIRLVETDHSPAMLVCHSQQGRKWFVRAPSVPERWFPRDRLDAESFAFGILFGAGRNDTMPRLVGAEAWFERWEAERFEIHEQTIRTAPDEVLTILLLSAEDMLRGE